jgi:hypothetical protein
MKMSGEPIEVKLDDDKDAVIVEESTDINDFNGKINQLSDTEHKRIVKDLMSGKQYKYFELKYFKNGSVRLVRKKEPSKRQVITERTKNEYPKNSFNDKVYMTDQQLLWEHVIEMNKEIERLRHKNKKRKQQVAELANDVYYVDEGEIEEAEVEVEKEVEVETPKPNPKPSTRSNAQNWRSRLKYLH